MVRTLAKRERRTRNHVNAILPGLVLQSRCARCPMRCASACCAPSATGRLVEPAEIAAAVAFLVSAEAAQISGQAIAVDGAASLSQLSLGRERR